VLRGAKRFTLMPPSDRPWLGVAEFETGEWRRDPTTGWEVAMDSGAPRVEWIELDPADREAAQRKHPPFAAANPIDVVVEAGDTLYIPALWYHRVQNIGPEMTIAVNHWHDMAYDPKAVYNFLVERLTPAPASD